MAFTLASAADTLSILARMAAKSALTISTSANVVLEALLQVGAQRLVQQRQVNLDGGALSGRARYDRMQHGADFDLGVLADIDGAIDEERDVGADDLGDIHFQRFAVCAHGAAHADRASRIFIVLAIEVPQADGEGGGVLCCQRQEILDEGVRGVLIEENRQRVVDLGLWRNSAGRREKLVPGKCEFVGQGMSPGCARGGSVSGPGNRPA